MPDPVPGSAADDVRWVWLVVNANNETVSVLADKTAAENVVARVNGRNLMSKWKVERWALR